MALLKCEDCGHDVSSRAEACPHCGCPVPKDEPPSTPPPVPPPAQALPAAWTERGSTRAPDSFDRHASTYSGDPKPKYREDAQRSKSVHLVGLLTAATLLGSIYMAINEGHVGNPLMTLAGGLGAGLVPLAFSGIVLALTSQRSYAWTTLCIVSFLMYGDVPPILSSTAIWSPIPNHKEIGREEALFRRTDHRLPA